MKNKFNSKFIFDMRGFWADERVEGGLWNLSNPIYRMVFIFFKGKEKEFIAHADHIISLTNNGRKEIESWNIKSAPITVIPTCVDLELFDPLKITNDQQKSLRKRLGIEESHFVLLYLGSWGTWYLPDETLRVFSELKKQKPSAKLLIVSPDQIDLAAYQYKTDVIISYSSRLLVPLHISIANAAVFFIKPSFSKKASSATKLGELLAMKKMVITNKGWGDVEQQDYGKWLHFVDAEKDFLFDWIDVQPTQSPNLVGLSLSRGIESYNLVYTRL